MSQSGQALSGLCPMTLFFSYAAWLEGASEEKKRKEPSHCIFPLVSRLFRCLQYMLRFGSSFDVAHTVQRAGTVPSFPQDKRSVPRLVLSAVRLLISSTLPLGWPAARLVVFFRKSSAFHWEGKLGQLKARVPWFHFPRLMAGWWTESGSAGRPQKIRGTENGREDKR